MLDFYSLFFHLLLRAPWRDMLIGRHDDQDGTYDSGIRSGTYDSGIKSATRTGSFYC